MDLLVYIVINVFDKSCQDRSAVASEYCVECWVFCGEGRLNKDRREARWGWRKEVGSEGEGGEGVLLKRGNLVQEHALQRMSCYV